ncbi:LPS-assembly protein LptD [Desulfogranum mediterraneum]|uniref:LPS-assembly protein LptD n=1 Tax=Desulfogranum mediterraneum TaxID=160661 RepID=UPI001376E164|nr:LPS assembly protein LptD [Desulfogranum mediterraneum]
MAETVDALQWEITADKLTRYEDPPTVIAEGNVVLEKKESVTRRKKKQKGDGWSDLLGEEPAPAEEPEAVAEGEPADQDDEDKLVTTTKVLTTIKADWMVYDADLGRVKARGNLVIDVGPDQLSAESGVVDLEHETGTFENASIIRQYKDMHLEGRVVEKTGDLTYHIEDGWIITCKLKEDETPPWSFGAADAEITDGGYAFLKHATFRIKDVPVFYSPYMILPAKRTRQTGFLFPAISTSDRDGFGFELPFFINLSRSSDITLYPQYMAERGLMLGGEFRYIADTTDKGAIMANYLSDDLSDPSQVEYYQETGYTHTNKDRYWIRGKADHDFGEWTTRFDLDVVSDKDYLTEFTSGLTGFTTSHNRFLEIFGRGFQNKSEQFRNNTAEILRSWDNGTSLQGQFLVVNDLSDPDVSPSRLWKLPSLSYTGLLPVYDNSGIDFSWNADYVNYWREEGVGAHRVDLHPKLTMAVPLSKYLETTVRAGVRDTFYALQVNGDNQEANGTFEDGDTQNRLLADFGAEIGTTMIGDFNADFGEIYAFSHTFRPYVSYDFISDDDQDDLPKLDSVDTIGDKNIIYYGIDNFFDIFGEKNEKKYERNYGYLKIKQGYDLRNAESDTPLTPIDAQLAYYPLEDLRLKYKTEIDVYGDGVFAHTVEADLRSNRGDYLSADYKYNDLKNTNSIRADAWLVLPWNFAVGYGIERAIEAERTIEEEFRLLYQPACWSVEFLSNYKPGNQTYMIMFRLANIGNPLGLDLPGF